MVVVYRSSLATVTAAKRRTTPMGWLAAWCVKKASGTALQRAVSTLLVDSWIGRLSAAIGISLLVGVVVDLSISIAFAGPRRPPVGAVLAATLAFGAGGGVGGALAGALWGWLIGKLADVLSAKAAFDHVANILGTIGAWCLAAALGYWIGRAAIWCYDHLGVRHSKLRRGVEQTAAILAVGATSLFVAQLARWVIRDSTVLKTVTEQYAYDVVVATWTILTGTIVVFPGIDWLFHELGESLAATEIAINAWGRELEAGRYRPLGYIAYQWTPIGNFCLTHHPTTLRIGFASLGILATLWLGRQRLSTCGATISGQVGVVLLGVSLVTPLVYMWRHKRLVDANGRDAALKKRFDEWGEVKRRLDEWQRSEGTQSRHRTQYDRLFTGPLNYDTNLAGVERLDEMRAALAWVDDSLKRHPYEPVSIRMFVRVHHKATIALWMIVIAVGAVMVGPWLWWV